MELVLLVSVAGVAGLRGTSQVAAVVAVLLLLGAAVVLVVGGRLFPDRLSEHGVTQKKTRHRS